MCQWMFNLYYGIWSCHLLVSYKFFVHVINFTIVLWREGRTKIGKLGCDLYMSNYSIIIIFLHARFMYETFFH